MTSGFPPKLRELLVPAPSPDPRHDYLVGLQGRVGEAQIDIRYVPDRLIVSPQSVAVYLAALDPTCGAEELALRILDDFNNELVPRWAQVTARRDQPLPHWATVEDRQPGWTPAEGFAPPASMFGKGTMPDQ
jgi:7-cyano-7-deazaguanine reductase